MRARVYIRTTQAERRGKTMSENLGFAMRVKYVKQGRLAYLSHLETIRSMERIIRRAALPYAVTEGFNPHMKVSFGPALPCGAAGLG